MKIIVSSIELMKSIKKAFDVDTHAIQYDPDKRAIVFITLRNNSNITLYVECQNKKFREGIVFNHLKMAKLLIFLKDLSHQPISVTLEDDFVRVEYAIIDF